MLNESWSLLINFFPSGWQEKAYQTGALARKRKVESPETLMRILLIHLADGKSLRTVATYAKEAGLCNLNDTSLLRRLKSSREWFRWISVNLLHTLENAIHLNQFSSRFRIRLVDGTVVNEQGSTGSDWRIHYSLNLTSLHCDTFKVTQTKVGESLSHYAIAKDDLIMADRGYCNRQNICYVLNNGGHVIIRLNQVSLPLKTSRGYPFALLKKLRLLKDAEIGDWDVYFFDTTNNLQKGRLCAIRKSQEAIEKAKKELRRKASKHGRKIRPETFEFAEYILIFTTLNRFKMKAKIVMHLYRIRWQIEIAFKRLKTIVGLGHLPKSDPDSCKAWLYGKLLIALLVERIHREVEFISPWGYPIGAPN